MFNKSLLRLGDSTPHGGKIISAQDNFILKGRTVAGVGEQVSFFT
ncbi:PAAR domain-containing protein [Providencia manganoxydans]